MTCRAHKTPDTTVKIQKTVSCGAPRPRSDMRSPPTSNSVCNRTAVPYRSRFQSDRRKTLRRAKTNIPLAAAWREEKLRRTDLQEEQSEQSGSGGDGEKERFLFRAEKILQKRLQQPPKRISSMSPIEKHLKRKSAIKSLRSTCADPFARAENGKLTRATKRQGRHQSKLRKRCSFF